MAIAAAVAAVRLISESGPACQAAVPAYFYPGPDWAQAIASKPAPSIMIMDITSSGAGTSPDRNYRAAVKRAQAAGIKIMGYSNTDYTQRSVRAVETDVRNYKAWYNVTDIFLDGVSSSSAGVPLLPAAVGLHTWHEPWLDGHAESRHLPEPAIHVGR